MAFLAFGVTRIRNQILQAALKTTEEDQKEKEVNLSLEILAAAIGKTAV